jgi:predicted N-formylglutamate amidohydrolase
LTDPAADPAAVPLLGPGDPPPYRWHRATGRRPWLLVCDHAGRAFPAALGRLGLPVEATWRHIAWDLGAGRLACALAERLDAPALLASYSRLVVDCNRRLEDATAFAVNGDGHRIPGNEGLGDGERRRRAEACYLPYHAAIDAHLAARRAAGEVPVLIAVHSFTPVYPARARPWHVGVLWDGDGRIAQPLLAQLGRERGLVVGDNQPYSGRYPADYTVWRHAGRERHPAVCLEVRQDLLLTRAGVAEWAARLGDALLAVVDAALAGEGDV